LAPTIAKRHRQYPQIELDIDLLPRRVDLIAEEFAGAVRIGALPDSRPIAREAIKPSTDVARASSLVV
jgi:DNA-binding transcriptional LysR family regulator